MKGQTKTGTLKNNGHGGQGQHRRTNSRYSTGVVVGATSATPASPPVKGFATMADELAASVAASKVSHNGNDKLQGLVARSVGKSVTATVANGKRYQGTLISGNSGATGNSAFSVVVQKPLLVGTQERSDKDLTILLKDLVDLEISSQEGKESPKPAQDQSKTHTPYKPKFKTDGDISGGLHIRERELQRWVPDAHDAGNPLLTLEDSGAGWDQFKVNQDKFGVESTFDEHFYTTRINTSAPDYQLKVAKADRLAKEIEGHVTTDRHILEERGKQVDDSGLDEEDLYSGVDRTEDKNGADTRGDELMAALRSGSFSGLASPVSITTSEASTPAGKYVPPRNRSGNYDPAIISSSQAIKEATKGDSSPQAIESSSTKDEPNSTKGDSSSTNSAGTTVTSESTPNVSSNGTVPPSIPSKPQVNPNESFRLNAQSEINSLREFSANFKIPHKMPSDLLPILAKDKLRQDEILKKSEHEEPAKKKAEPSKPAFKLNPKAAVFTPSSASFTPAKLSPVPPKIQYKTANYKNNTSPRVANTRPYSGTSSNGSISSVRRHHQILPSEFFGGASKIPTKESQQKKAKELQVTFSLFITTRKKFADKSAIIYDKTFQTPPTWEWTVDETHDKLFPAPGLVKSPPMMMSSLPFIQNSMSPMLGAPVIPNVYPNGKFPISPIQQQHPQPNLQQQQQHQQAAMAHFQQQQFHAAMMYQQQFPPPGQAPMPMYGGEPYLPPGNFAPPQGGFSPGGPGNGGGSPVPGNVTPHYSGYNNGRRYNQGKRGGQAGQT